MRKRPIHKLAVRGSVRQLHAVEVCVGRYVGLLGAVIASAWIFWQAPHVAVIWITFLAVLAILVALFEPWHLELHLSMDSPVLRVRRVALGVLPVGDRGFELTGRRLAVERRGENIVPPDDSGIGCFLFLLPFPLGWILSGARSSKQQLNHVTRWVLCLRGSAGTEDLALLKRADVAGSFLEATREILPAHVDAD